MTSLAKTIDGTENFAKLERVLAVVCMTAPALMIIGDNQSIRDSISAYYNMNKSVLFYVPLSVAFMLFVVNGVIKQKSSYNIALGAALAGLVIFDRDHFEYIHYACAAAFFVGKAAAIVIYTSKRTLWHEAVLLIIIIASIAAWGLGLTTLFWAEWICLGVIGWHYILESWGVID
jgi:hypothetical protein